MGRKSIYRRNRHRGTRQQNIRDRAIRKRRAREANAAFFDFWKSTRADGSDADPHSDIPEASGHHDTKSEPVAPAKGNE